MSLVRSDAVADRRYIWTVPTTPGTLGEVVRAQRQERGWTGYQLVAEFEEYQKRNGVPVAERIKFNQGQLSAIELNKNKSPDPAKLVILNVILGLAPGTLESMAGNRGAALRAQHTAPPGSVVIMPEAGALYRAASQLQSLSDEDLEIILERIEFLQKKRRPRRKTGTDTSDTSLPA